MAECDVCYEAVEQWYQVSGYGCCSGLFCNNCKSKLKNCPMCRSDTKQVICAICAIRDSKEQDKKIRKRVVKIYKDVERMRFMGHHLPYCTDHLLKIIDYARTCGLNHSMCNSIYFCNGSRHQFTPNYGYSKCIKCREIIFVDEFHDCPSSEATEATEATAGSVRLRRPRWRQDDEDEDDEDDE